MAKAGRKRKQGIKREPNGQASRTATEKPRDTVLGVRMRMYGISRQRAESNLAGFEIGRMALRGDFGKDYQPSLNAVEEYVNAAADYFRIKCPLQQMPKAMDYMAGRGLSTRSEPSLKTVQKIEQRYDDVATRLAKADPAARIIFHEIAFHDRSHGERGVQAVNHCVKALRGA